MFVLAECGPDRQKADSYVMCMQQKTRISFEFQTISEF